MPLFLHEFVTRVRIMMQPHVVRPTRYTPWRLIVIFGNTSPRSCTVNSGGYGVKGDGQVREVSNGVKKDITVATTSSPVLLLWW